MRIEIPQHTLERAAERGTDESQIHDVIEKGELLPAKRGRLRRARVYQFNAERLGVYYPEKRVEVFYVVEGDRIVTVTVYVF